MFYGVGVSSSWWLLKMFCWMLMFDVCWSLWWFAKCWCLELNFSLNGVWSWLNWSLELLLKKFWDKKKYVWIFFFDILLFSVALIKWAVGLSKQFAVTSNCWWFEQNNWIFLQISVNEKRGTAGKNWTKYYIAWFEGECWPQEVKDWKYGSTSLRRCCFK